jgi:hypothetical protein
MLSISRASGEMPTDDTPPQHLAICRSSFDLEMRLAAARRE